MDMQDQNPRDPAPRIGSGEWLRQEVEFRLPRGWLVGGGIVFFLLLLVALD